MTQLTEKEYNSLTDEEFNHFLETNELPQRMR